MGTILLVLKKLISNRTAMSILIIITLFVLLMLQFSKSKRLSEDNERLGYNLENANFKIDSVKTKNGELQFSVNQLTVTNKEFGKLNSDFEKELKDMKLKYKNLENATKIEIRYITKYDTIPAKPINPDNTGKAMKFEFTKEDKFTKITGNINTSEPVNNTFIDSMIIDVKDGITTAFETKYKGWWFWRKPVSTTLHIKSDNPSMRLDKVETYKFKSK